MGSPYLLTVCSSVLALLLFPQWEWAGFAFFVMIPILYALYQLVETKQPWYRFFLLGFVFGAILMAGFHRWIWTLTFWAPWYWVGLVWLVSALYYALFYAAAFALVGFLYPYVPMSILVPSVWVMGEWARGLGVFGNTAASLGYASVQMVMPFAQYVGLYGLSFFIVFVNWQLLELIRGSNRKRHGLLLILIFFGVVFIAQWRVFRQSEPLVYEKVAVVQPNHEQIIKMDARQWANLRTDFLSFTRQADSVLPRWVFFPETITPALNLERFSFLIQLQQLAANLDCFIVWGTSEYESGRYYNSAVLTSRMGLGPARYRKMRLMPFGEYWPLRRLYQRFCSTVVVGTDYSRGSELALLRADGMAVGPLICLEAIYPNSARQSVFQGANLLCVLANNAWFFNSSAAAELLQMSRMRAVETDRYLVQAANTGISAVISNFGEVLCRSNLNERLILSGVVAMRQSKTLYVLAGDWVVLACGFIVILGFRRRFLGNF